MFSSTSERVRCTWICVQLRALLARVFQSARLDCMFRADYLGICHFVLPYALGECFPSQFSEPSRTVSAATRTGFSFVEERRCCRRVCCSLRAPRRAAPRRTSYPAASGASTLIGPSTRNHSARVSSALNWSVGTSRPGDVGASANARGRTVRKFRAASPTPTAAVAARPSPGRHQASRRLSARMDAGRTSPGVSAWT